MEEVDWFYFKPSHKLIFLSIILSGLLGWILFGGIGCLVFLILDLGTLLIAWACN